MPRQPPHVPVPRAKNFKSSFVYITAPGEKERFLQFSRSETVSSFFIFEKIDKVEREEEGEKESRGKEGGIFMVHVHVHKRYVCNVHGRD